MEPGSRDELDELDIPIGNRKKLLVPKHVK